MQPPTKQSYKKPTDSKGTATVLKSKKIKSLNLSQQFKQILQLIVRYQVVIIIVLVTGLLALTTLKMLRYSDPAPDEQRTQENLSKIKPIHLDTKAVERIKQLNDSQTSTSSNIQNNRSNPFSE